jgi:recombination DNA repair RAD52 pathway protein
MSIQEKLDESIPKECIADKGGLDYISHRYVKQRLNEVFGYDGWNYKVVETYQLSLDEDSVRWFTQVRLSADGFNVVRDGIAIGHGTFKTKRGPVSPGRANEIVDFAAAESVTDALKRAAVSLGNSLGLELYPMVPKGQEAKKKTGGAAPRPAPKKKTQAKKDIKF